MSADTKKFSARRRRAALLGLLFGTTALIGLAVHDTPATAQMPAAIAPIAVAPAQGFAPLVNRVKAAVVTITASEIVRASDGAQPFARPGRQPQERNVRGLGSGFIIDAEGHIVTNNHVIDGARRVTVTLEDGTELAARVVGRDPRTDVALLKVEAGKPLPHVVFGDSDVAQPGDWVVAVGNPYGLGGTVTAGVVSARGRAIGAGPYDDFIQVDAPINRGNSGGPLFAQDGSVIGVNTAIYSPTGGSVGIGFAVPSNMVRTVVTQLQDKGRVERGFLGVTTQPVDAGMAAALKLPRAGGALVAEVQPDSPAAAAGLKPGDVITSVEGKELADSRALARAVADIAPGKSAQIGVYRDGGAQTLTVTVASQPDAQQSAQAGDAAAQGKKLGVALAAITPQARRALGLSADQQGAVIGEVADGSPAQEAGLRAGDVIVAVGRQPVTNPEQASAAIREGLSNGDSLALRILRDGRSAFVAVDTAKG